MNCFARQKENMRNKYIALSIISLILAIFVVRNNYQFLKLYVYEAFYTD